MVSRSPHDHYRVAYSFQQIYPMLRRFSRCFLRAFITVVSTRWPGIISSCVAHLSRRKVGWWYRFIQSGLQAMPARFNPYNKKRKTGNNFKTPAHFLKGAVDSRRLLYLRQHEGSPTCAWFGNQQPFSFFSRNFIHFPIFLQWENKNKYKIIEEPQMHTPYFPTRLLSAGGISLNGQKCLSPEMRMLNVLRARKRYNLFIKMTTLSKPLLSTKNFRADLDCHILFIIRRLILSAAVPANANGK